MKTELNKIDLNNINSVWLIGIKGTGMAAIAQVFVRLGKQVAGSDVDEDFFTKEILDDLQISVNNFSADNITDNIDLVIYSVAYPEDHPELVVARNKNIPTITLTDGHALLMKNKKSIAVAGTHGKTTTTAILGYIMQQADFDPTVLVGAPIPQFNGSALVGGSEYFVIEACEYKHKFQQYSPMSLILHNIDYDHPDTFSTIEEYVDEFIMLAQKIPSFGFIAANVDDSNIQKVLSRVNVEIIPYGTVPSAEWRIEHDPEGSSIKSQNFSIFHRGNLWAKGNTQLQGNFNLTNILAAVVVAVKFNISQDIILKSIKRFRSPKRRFEYIGETEKGAIIIDDFAHHPTAIQVTLRTIRDMYPNKKITTVFHPHTFSRTASLFNDFAQSFRDVDRAIILDIYGSAREEHGGTSSEQLIEAINKFSNNANYASSQDEAYSFLENNLDEDDILVTLGAGDVWKLAERLKK